MTYKEKSNMHNVFFPEEYTETIHIKSMILNLRIQKKWIGDICSGKKDEKYLPYTRHWIDKLDIMNSMILAKKPCYCCLSTRDNKMQVVAPVKKIRAGVGNPEMGAPIYTPVLILVLDVSNIKIKEL